MTWHRQAREWRAAFTLVEVLAALLLAAIVLPVAMQAISVATHAAGDARRRLEAAALAEGKLAELVAAGEWQTAELSGGFAPEYPEYTWRAEVTEWPTAAGLRQLAVEVGWVARGRERAVTLTTLVRPAEQ